MYPAKPGLIIGFHGCDQKLQKNIVRAGSSLIPSTNNYDWLGNGIYFWENNKERALAFAQELKNSNRNSTRIKTPAVLGAVIDMGFCLDLMDSEYIKLVSASYATLKESFKILDLKLPINKSASGSRDLLLRDLDCAVIENLHLQRMNNDLHPFDSVRGVFVEGKPLYEGAGFHDKNHIQICIRNPNCIKGYFIPRVADNRFDIP